MKKKLFFVLSALVIGCGDSPTSPDCPESRDAAEPISRMADVAFNISCEETGGR